MNDLIISSNLQKSFPTIVDGLRKAQSVLDQIHSFEDVERVFLMGAGLSPNTYRSYLTAVRQLYDFTGGLNPLQITPAWIEKFYDYLVKKVDRNTAYLRVRGLKKFFAGIRNVIPFYTSPFEIMSETLNRKLNRTKKGNRTKKALLRGELRALLDFLDQDKTIKGLENYAISLTLVTSGLRASELCQLCWDKLDYLEGRYIAYFIGKGGKDAEQELYPEAVNAVKLYFYKQFNRMPAPGDRFFYSLESYKDRQFTPLVTPTLWVRIRDIGIAARAAGIIKRDLQFSPHLFRRTYASLLFKAGMDIKALQLATRHANV
ncbi:MAG: tyrosine-type recombinase/integrase [Planctomycetes bacterium]|nr:tyrosine-type recombinase/integrase [Planctomycetota bacterium]